MILAVTGHRPPKVGGYRVPNRMSLEASQLVAQYLSRERPEYVITGMALGFDQWVAQVCMSLGVPYHAYIPFPGQDAMWPFHAKQAYQRLVSGASEVFVTSQGNYEPRLMQVRNEMMVDCCDKLLALWDGTSGGTANCINYALAHRKVVDRLPVSAETWTWCREQQGLNVPRQFRRSTPPAAQETVGAQNMRRRRTPAQTAARSTIVEDLMREQRIQEAERTIQFAETIRQQREEIVRSMGVPPQYLGIDMGQPDGDRTAVVVRESRIVTPPASADPIGSLARDMDEDAAREMLRALQQRLGVAPKASKKQDTHTDRFAPRRKIDLDDD